MDVTHNNPLAADGGQAQNPARTTTLYESIPEDIKVLLEPSRVCAIFLDSLYAKRPRLIARFNEPKPLAAVCAIINAKQSADSDRFILLLEDGTVMYIRDKRYCYYYRDFEHNDLEERSGIDFVRDVRRARESAREAVQQNVQEAAAPNAGTQAPSPAVAARHGMVPFLRERLMVPMKGMFWFNGSALLAMPADFAMREPRTVRHFPGAGTDSSRTETS